MKRCPNCGAEYADETLFCPKDGGRLISEGTELDGDPLLGTVIGARYRLIERIGSGAMGSVYRARNVHAEFDVAIKVLHQAARTHPDIARRFEEEKRIIARLRHPNILKLLDSLELPTGDLALVFEFVNGQTLADRLKVGRLDEQQTLFIMREICDALTEAHGAGIIHRDLKPANLMIERIGDRPAIKILDFGIAKNLSVTGHTLGHTLGTPAYMSPEQGRGIELDGRSDLYALGVIAYECLTGQVPFRADNGIAVVQMHLTVDPPTFESIDPHLSVDADMEDFVRHLLEKDAEQRPDSARQTWQFATELQQHYLDSTGSHGSIDLGLIDPSAGESVARPPSGRFSTSRSSLPSARRSRRSKTRKPGPHRDKIRILLMIALFSALGAGGLAIYNYSSAGSGCGNAILDPGEDCDDGNTIDTDVCTNQCRSNIAYLHGLAQGEQRFFLMGSKEPPRKGWIATTETPATPVLLDPFFLMRNEVTREAWAAFQDTSNLFSSPAKIKPAENLKSRPKHPMTDVTIREARAYCQWLGGDLPDESQWEYAARSGGKDQEYPWGNEEPTCRLAITGNHKCSMGKPAPVCDRPLGNSEQGVCDLAGNVWEFVLSVFPPPSVQRTRENSFRTSNPWIEAKELPYNKTFLHYEIQLDELPSAYPGIPGEKIGRTYWDSEVQGVNQSGRPKDPQQLPEVASFANAAGGGKIWPLDTKWQIIRGGGFWHTVEFFNRARSRYFVPHDKHEPNIGFRCAFRQAPPTVDARRASLNMVPKRAQRSADP